MVGFQILQKRRPGSITGSISLAIRVTSFQKPKYITIYVGYLTSFSVSFMISHFQVVLIHRILQLAPIVHQKLLL